MDLLLRVCRHPATVDCPMLSFPYSLFICIRITFEPPVSRVALASFVMYKYYSVRDPRQSARPFGHLCSPAMYLLSQSGVRAIYLFIGFGSLALHTVANFFVCEPGWEWVNTLSNFSRRPRAKPGGGDRTDSFSPPRLTAKALWSCGYLGCALRGARWVWIGDLLLLSIVHEILSQVRLYWVLYDRGRTM